MYADRALQENLGNEYECGAARQIFTDKPEQKKQNLIWVIGIVALGNKRIKRLRHKGKVIVHEMRT